MKSFSFREWWWVALSLFCLFFFYPIAMQSKKKEMERLSFQLQEKKVEKLSVLAEREDLQLQINSQNDPNWIEMLLIRDLGMVPEGWLKVHFISKR
ncbi:MAG TPA: hypothetical protein VJK48_05690 [Chlamydiales bacterium]|nr:hypothetical protein [Chlamydiales bacterium]